MHNDDCNYKVPVEGCAVPAPSESMKDVIMELHDMTMKARSMSEEIRDKLFGMGPIKDFPNGGYWCLCENGYIIPPSGHGFMAKERPNWVFSRQKPEEDDHDERKENENV